jgi:hypothetical protein
MIFMLLRAGKFLRFKGRDAEAEAAAFAAALHGRCIREGTHILITRETRLGVMTSTHAQSRIIPMFERGDFGT